MFTRRAGPNRRRRSDRFIPSGGASKAAQLHLLTNHQDRARHEASHDQVMWKQMLAEALFDGEHKKNILSFSSSSHIKSLSPWTSHDIDLSERFTERQQAAPAPTWSFSTTPVRKLDAPRMIDDFYLHLLDWSRDGFLAVALQQEVYLWQSSTSLIRQVLTNLDPENYVCSLRWLQSDSSSRLAIGSRDGSVQLMDVESGKVTRRLSEHKTRVNVMDWSEPILSSGSHDGQIVHSDTRQKEHVVCRTSTSNRAICGLRWSPSGDQLVVGDDGNACNVYERRKSDTVQHRLQGHTAAVKALAWHPIKDRTLATGAGTQDRHVRLFDTSTGKCLSSRNSGSQVSSLEWSHSGLGLVSAHGFTNNELLLWNYPRMTVGGKLRNHTGRVLCTAMSPDGTTVCSMGADEALCFWDVFEKLPRDHDKGESSRLTLRVR